MNCRVIPSLFLLAIACVIIHPALGKTTQVVSPSHYELDLFVSVPGAKSVAIRGKWLAEDLILHPKKAGVWTAPTPPLAAGCYKYSIVVNGLESADPEMAFEILHVPQTDSIQYPDGVPHGLVHGHRYWSKTFAMDRECWLYTPPGYEESKKMYPLLVLQHAGADTQKTWVMKGNLDWLMDQLIAGGRARPMLVLMLDGHPHGESTYVKRDTRVKAMNDLESELFEEAIPLVESNYRINSSRESRGLAGPSIGGGQAISIGLSHLDRFAWIGAFNAGHFIADFYQPALGHPEKVNEQLKLLWISCGTGDPEFANNQKLVAELNGNGIHNQWHATEGAHSWTVWRRDLAEFLSRVFQSAAGGEDAK